jgi:hypothetical protein
MSESTDPAPELCEACLQKRREWWARFNPPKIPEHDQIQAAITQLRDMTLGEQILALKQAGIDLSSGQFARPGTVYGLWHNGWCSFETTRHPDRLGYGFSGTAEEASAGREEFVREGQPAREYLVTEFDPARDPNTKPGTPSPAQLKLLRFVNEHGTGYAPWASRRTIAAIFERGWVTHNITADGQEGRPVLRLTAAGRRMLEAATAK